MKISYKKLWMLLIEKDITKPTLRKELGLSTGTMSKLNKGEDVALSVLLRICDYLNWDNCYKYCCKATVKEIIEHFKKD